MSLSKAQVILLRGKYEKLGTGLVIYGDNMVMASDVDGSYIIWDDTNELYHAIRQNRHPDYKEQSKYPISIQSSNYDQIQYINASTNQKEFEIFLDSLITDGVMSLDKKNEMIQKFIELKVLQQPDK